MRRKHFANATNMTDRAAALTVLAHRHAGSRPRPRQALAAFEARFAANPLVMDKWFTIQATVPGAGTLETRQGADAASRTSPIANPNRVRALIGTFATANQTGFNRADGAGYDFFARRHPRRSTSAIRSSPRASRPRCARGARWSRCAQGKAREALLLIAGAEDLSADLRDIVERTLA